MIMLKCWAVNRGLSSTQRNVLKLLPKDTIDQVFRLKIHTKCDVVISGGGMVGFACASALSQLECMKNRKIVLLEGGPDRDIQLSEQFSNRVVALRPASIKLLDRIGAWDLIKSHRVSPVHSMQVWESCSDASLHFYDEENPGQPLNYIVENDAVVKFLTEVAKKSANLDIRFGAKMLDCSLPPGGENLPTENVRISMENGDTIETSLLVGADGFRSLVRQKIGCDTLNWEYDQMGLVATLTLQDGHSSNKTAFQRFLTTGPIGILPLSDSKCSLVWSLPTNKAKALVGISESDFVERLNTALTSRRDQNDIVNRIGSGLNLVLQSLNCPDSQQRTQLPPTFTGVSNRAMFPLGFSHSTRYIGPRTVLVGDSAHRIHPLAGQGVNLGFGDVDTLAKSITASISAGAGIGNYYYLCQYETERQKANVPMMFAVDSLQKFYSTSLLPVVLARSVGVQLTNSLSPLKKMLMNEAAG